MPMVTIILPAARLGCHLPMMIIILPAAGLGCHLPMMIIVLPAAGLGCHGNMLGCHLPMMIIILPAAGLHIDKVTHIRVDPHPGYHGNMFFPGYGALGLDPLSAE